MAPPQTPAMGSTPRSTGRCAPMEIESAFVSLITPRELIMTRSRDCFRELKKVGEGTYGAVFLAEDIRTKERVALKRIKLNDLASQKEGITITTLREINHLFKVEHENVVKLKEVVYGGTNLRDCTEIYMVLEYLEHDLLGIQQRLKSRQEGHGRHHPPKLFSIGDVKCYMRQLLCGLDSMHKSRVLHRDLKSANLLVNRQGVLKIADFGLSRKAPQENALQPEKLTPKVCTLWYRPPELLLAGTGSARWAYGSEVDIWSAGCIFAELLAGVPLFNKNEEVEALYAIVHTCGSPNPAEWPEVVNLPGWEGCRKEFKENRLKQVLKDKNMSKEEDTAVNEAIDIIGSMLAVTPSKRLKAAQIYVKDFFDAEFSKPPPTLPQNLEGIDLEDSHTMDFERSRKHQDDQPRHWQKAGQSGRAGDNRVGGPAQRHDNRHPGGNRYDDHSQGERGWGAGSSDWQHSAHGSGAHYDDGAGRHHPYAGPGHAPHLPGHPARQGGRSGHDQGRFGGAPHAMRGRGRGGPVKTQGRKGGPEQKSDVPRNLPHWMRKAKK